MTDPRRGHILAEVTVACTPAHSAIPSHTYPLPPPIRPAACPGLALPDLSSAICRRLSARRISKGDAFPLTIAGYSLLVCILSGSYPDAALLSDQDEAKLDPKTTTVNAQSAPLPRIPLPLPEFWPACFQPLVQLIDTCFRHTSAYQHLHMSAVSAAILSDIQWIEVKDLVADLASTLALPTMPISLSRLLLRCDGHDQLSAALARFYSRAASIGPCIITIEDLDLLASSTRLDNADRQSLASALASSILKAQAHPIFTIATAQSTKLLPSTLLSPDIPLHTFPISPPSAAERLPILLPLLSPLESPSLSESFIREASLYTASKTSGYSRSDLHRLASKIFRRASLSRHPMESITPIIDTVLSQTPPSLHTAISTSISSPAASQGVRIKGGPTLLAGYDRERHRLESLVTMALEGTSPLGMPPPSGILLYGPSGCGKSLVLRELITRRNINAITVKGPELFSKYMGETEATLRAIFSSARASAPCLIFLDEIESLGARRGWGAGEGGEGVAARVLSTLLNEIDGVGESRGVLVVGATNAPWDMDDALIRPGRFDHKILLRPASLPDIPPLVRLYGGRMGLAAEADDPRLAQALLQLSPSSIAKVFRDAAIITLRHDIHATSVPISALLSILEEQRENFVINLDRYNAFLLGR